MTVQQFRWFIVAVNTLCVIASFIAGVYVGDTYGWHLW